MNACQHNETLGVQRDGAMREYMALPWQKIIPVKGVNTRDAALIEPMSVGFHAVDRGQVTDIDTVVVFGCGMVGLGAVVRAVQRGATVIAVDLSAEKLQIAKDLGAKYGINSKEENLLEKVMEYTDGYGADCVIEAVGSPITYTGAIDIVSFAIPCGLHRLCKERCGVPDKVLRTEGAGHPRLTQCQPKRLPCSAEISGKRQHSDGPLRVRNLHS